MARVESATVAGGSAAAMAGGAASTEAAALAALPLALVRPQDVGRRLILHVVGRLTPPVLGVLLPRVSAAGHQPAEQVLVVMDAERSGDQLQSLPPTVRVLALPDAPSAWRRIGLLSEALRVMATYRPVQALHLHGLLPALAGVRLLRQLPHAPAEVSFTPHGSRALSRGGIARQVLWRLLRHGLGLRPGAALPTVPSTAVDQHPAPVANPMDGHLEGAASAVFFQTPRHEAGRPLLLSASVDAERDAVDRYVRIAILLGDERLGLNFNWVGPSSPEVDEQLRAAGVGQFSAADTDAGQRAMRIGSAWVYVAPVEEQGFPIRLVEAMAGGLPCVALDTPVHRDVLTDGEDGYLCGDLYAMLGRIAELVDSAPLRRSIGGAARRTAQRRFSESAIVERLRAEAGVPALSAAAPVTSPFVNPDNASGPDWQERAA